MKLIKRNKEICKHNYNIIGTGFLPEYIEVDIVCIKCGKTKTVYVKNSYIKEIIDIASEHKQFKIPRDAIMDV